MRYSRAGIIVWAVAALPACGADSGLSPAMGRDTVVVDRPEIEALVVDGAATQTLRVEGGAVAVQLEGYELDGDAWHDLEVRGVLRFQARASSEELRWYVKDGASVADDMVTLMPGARLGGVEPGTTGAVLARVEAGGGAISFAVPLPEDELGLGAAPVLAAPWDEAEGDGSWWQPVTDCDPAGDDECVATLGLRASPDAESELRLEVAGDRNLLVLGRRGSYSEVSWSSGAVHLRGWVESRRLEPAAGSSWRGGGCYGSSSCCGIVRRGPVERWSARLVAGALVYDGSHREPWAVAADAEALVRVELSDDAPDWAELVMVPGVSSCGGQLSGAALRRADVVRVARVGY